MATLSSLNKSGAETARWRFGQRVQPVRRSRSKSTSLESAFFVSSKIPIGPLLLSDFVTVAPITDEQSSALQNALGVLLTKTAREEIDAAIHRMVGTIALAARIPSWGDFREQLSEIINSGQTCIKAAQQFVQMTDPRALGKDKPKGTLTADQAVKTYLSLAGIKDSIVQVDIDGILETCQRALDEVKPRASKRGPKPNIALDNFLNAIETVAQNSGAPIKLPSDNIRGKGELRPLTAFFRFGRECLKIAITNGERAIAAASLMDDERPRVEKMFSDLREYIAGDRKSDGAFLSRWREAKAALKTIKTAN